MESSSLYDFYFAILIFNKKRIYKSFIYLQVENACHFLWDFNIEFFLSKLIKFVQQPIQSIYIRTEITHWTWSTWIGLFSTEEERLSFLLNGSCFLPLIYIFFNLINNIIFYNRRHCLLSYIQEQNVVFKALMLLILFLPIRRFPKTWNSLFIIKFQYLEFIDFWLIFIEICF